MRIIGVEKLGDDLFSISAGNEVETCRSKCRLVQTNVSGSDPVRVMQFDSEEFNKRIMLGEIMIQEIREVLAHIA
ncbi:hypothetical protein [Rhizobium sp.]